MCPQDAQQDADHEEILCSCCVSAAIWCCTQVLRMDSWLGLLEQGHLLDADLGMQQAQLCFLWSKMMVIHEIKDFSRHESISFVDFLEALARVAELKSLPSFSDLEDAG